MHLQLLLSALMPLFTRVVLAEPCGGTKDVYVCNPTNPTRFDICIGDQKYTMSCPGGLHFNSKTQVCDWPQNADCAQNPAGPSPFSRTSPKPQYRKSPSHPTPTPGWHRHRQDSNQASGHYQESHNNHDRQGSQHYTDPAYNYDNSDYYTNKDQANTHGPPGQGPPGQDQPRQLNGHVRAPETSDDPRYALSKSPFRKEDNEVKYHDAGYVSTIPKKQMNPFSYKDTRGRVGEQLQDSPRDSQQQHGTRDQRQHTGNNRELNTGVSDRDTDFKANTIRNQNNNFDFKSRDQDGSRYADQDTNSNSNTLDKMNDNNYIQDSSNKRNDGFSLHHYPWWASRSSTPKALRQRIPLPTSRTATQKTRWYQKKNFKQDSQLQGLVPSYQPAAAARRYQPQPQPQQVPAQQPLSAAAAAGPPAQSISAAAATEPKRNKKPRKTGHCTASTCQLPDCRCVGPDIPGGLDVKDTPQMVMLTFDDSVNIANYDYYTKLFDSKFRNPNGCPIKGTFYVSGDATQYHYVEKLYKQGHEIASHSISHRSPTTYWATAGYSGYVEEIEGMRKKLAKESKVKKDDIKGMRVPFLQVGGDDQYQMLEDYGFTYDTSMVTGHLYRNDHAPVWPFTLDYPPDSKTCSLTPCPTKSYPGLWEVPLIRWYGSNRLACAMPDGCTIDPDTKGTLKFIMDNFNRHYETNRSPIGIFLHASWFRRKDGNLEGLLEFLEQMTQKKDVWVVSVSQVIDWIRNPVPNSQAGNIPSWSCK